MKDRENNRRTIRWIHISDYRTRLSSHKNLVSQHKLIIEDHIHGLEGHNRLDQLSRFWSECSLDRTIATTSSIYYNSYSSAQPFIDTEYSFILS